MFKIHSTRIRNLIFGLLLASIFIAFSYGYVVNQNNIGTSIIEIETKNSKALISQNNLFSPLDPNVSYNPNYPPDIPPFGTLARWVSSDTLEESYPSFKSYFYKGISFRLIFPRSYSYADNNSAVYPLLVFFAGSGEAGSVYDNNSQLRHGGNYFSNLVLSGKFDGFVLIPQSSLSDGRFNNNHFSVVQELIDLYFIKYLSVDPSRIILTGISNGASASIEMARNYPNIISSSVSISLPFCLSGGQDYFKDLQHLSLWLVQGQLDPENKIMSDKFYPYTSGDSKFKHTNISGQRHRCWNEFWQSEDFNKYLNVSHIANPKVVSGSLTQCNEKPVNLLIGTIAGASVYQWKVNENIIEGENSNVLRPQEYGEYYARVKREHKWSSWSLRPLKVIKNCSKPSINFSDNLRSDGISLPFNPDNPTLIKATTGFSYYQWKLNGGVIKGENRNFITPKMAGTYSAMIKKTPTDSEEETNQLRLLDSNEQYNYLQPEAIQWDVNKDNQIKFTWAIKDTNSNVNFDDVYLEVIRSKVNPLAYETIAKFSDNTMDFTDSNMDETPYLYRILFSMQDGSRHAIEPKVMRNDEGGVITFYITWQIPEDIRSKLLYGEVQRAVPKYEEKQVIEIVDIKKRFYMDTHVDASQSFSYSFRAFNNSGASSHFSEIIASTNYDKFLPSIPKELKILDVYNNTADLNWLPSTDNDKLRNYIVSVKDDEFSNNGDPKFAATIPQSYHSPTIRIRAQDWSGNLSPYSRGVVANMSRSKIETSFLSNPDILTNNSLLAALRLASANSPVVKLTTDFRLSEINFAIIYRGYFKLPRPGNYSFKTRTNGLTNIIIGEEAEMESKLKIGKPNSEQTNKVVSIYTDHKLVKFVLLFYSPKGEKDLTLLWKKPESSEFSPIPEDVLFPPA